MLDLCGVCVRGSHGPPRPVEGPLSVTTTYAVAIGFDACDARLRL